MDNLWEEAYKNADEFFRIGLDQMRKAGYIVEYNEITKEFKFIPPNKKYLKETENDRQ